MWSHSPILLVEQAMVTMELATHLQSVQPREGLPLVHVPLLLESVVSFP